MNKAILIGRLTRDPELRTTPSGISVCTFTLAIDRPFKAQDGSKQADFIPVVVWRVQADNCGKYLAKGRMCAVTGTIQTRSYDKDGEKRYVTEVVADNVEFLSGNSNGNNTDDFGRKQTVEDLPSVEDDDDQLPF